jgi:hypothetical protein
MDEFNVWHNLLSAVSGRGECAHMYILRRSYRTLVFGRHLVVGGGQLIITWFEVDVTAFRQ